MLFDEPLPATLHVRQIILCCPRKPDPPGCTLLHRTVQILTCGRRVQVLDFMVVSSDSAERARATAAKKRSYYAMRAKQISTQVGVLRLYTA